MSTISYKLMDSKALLNKYSNKGLTGLCNLGNTCYINACMQILSHCYELNEVIENIHINNDEKSLILYEWKQLKDLMWTSNCVISPNRFISTIQHIAQVKHRELFTGYAQNDLPEFLIFLFDCFHEGIERKVDINIVGTSKNNIDDENGESVTLYRRC